MLVQSIYVALISLFNTKEFYKRLAKESSRLIPMRITALGFTKKNYAELHYSARGSSCIGLLSKKLLS